MLTSSIRRGSLEGWPPQENNYRLLFMGGERSPMMYRCPSCGTQARWLGNMRRHIRICSPLHKNESAKSLRIAGSRRPPRHSKQRTAGRVHKRRKWGRRGKYGHKLIKWRQTVETSDQRKPRKKSDRDAKYKYWMRNMRPYRTGADNDYGDIDDNTTRKTWGLNGTEVIHIYHSGREDLQNREVREGLKGGKNIAIEC